MHTFIFLGKCLVMPSMTASFATGKIRLNMHITYTLMTLMWLSMRNISFHIPQLAQANGPVP
jgi:hypothetical protein